MFRFKERDVAGYINLVGHAQRDVLLHEDGSLTLGLAFRGIAWQTADVSTIIARHGDYHNAFRNIADDTVTIGTYQCRGLADPSIYPKRRLPSAFAAHLDDLYRERLFSGGLFDNQLFVFVTVRPAQYVGKFLSRQVQKRSKVATSANAERLQHLYAIGSLLEAKLAGYGPRRLGIRKSGHVRFSEPAEALLFAMTGIWRPIGLSAGRMKNSLFSERLIFGREAIEIRTPGWSSYAAGFSMREYPSMTWPGMFAAMSESKYRCTIFQSLTFVSKATAESIMNRKQNYMVGSEDKAFEQLEELKQAGNDLMSNKFVLGDHTLFVLSFADSMSDLKAIATDAWRDLADSGAVVTRESAALEAAYFTMFPGNEHLRPRPGYVSSRNFTAMAPLHNYPAGPVTEHWGEAIAIFRTTANTPYRFHWHVDGVGNTLITGETGSGKTLLTSFLIAMTFGRARVFALDYKRGWELLFRAVGASYSILGDGEPHLAPLKTLTPTPKNLTFLNDLIRGCIRQDLTHEEDRRLSLALEIVMQLPPKERRLGEIAAFLGTDPGGAGSALQRWCHGNELGWVIDAPEDHIDLDCDEIAFDLTAILENPRARGAALLTLFHYIEQKLDGRPILIPNDEGWRALQDDIFRPMIERRLRTIRSFGGVFVFLTQGPGEIGKSDIGDVLVEQCPTQIRLPIDRANKAHYMDVLKSTEGEWAAFKQLRKGDGRFLVCQGGQSVVAELALPNMADEIAVLSANQETLTALDRVRETAGHKNRDKFGPEILDAVHRARLELAAKRRRELENA